MFGEVFALEPNDMSDQQFSILCGHLNKSSVESIGPLRIENRIHAEHFQRRRKDYLIRKAQGAGQDLRLLQLIRERDADATAADIDGSLDQCGLGRIRFPLQADGKRDRDAIVFTTISS